MQNVCALGTLKRWIHRTIETKRNKKSLDRQNDAEKLLSNGKKKVCEKIGSRFAVIQRQNGASARSHPLFRMIYRVQRPFDIFSARRSFLFDAKPINRAKYDESARRGAARIFREAMNACQMSMDDTAGDWKWGEWEEGGGDAGRQTHLSRSKYFQTFGIRGPLTISHNIALTLRADIHSDTRLSRIKESVYFHTKCELITTAATTTTTRSRT